MHNAWVQPRILDILIFQDKTLFCTFEAGDIVCWLVNLPIAKLTCSSQPTVAEFVKLTLSIVIEIQRQTADLHKVQLCNRQFFCGCPSNLRGEGIQVSPAWYNCTNFRTCFSNRRWYFKNPWTSSLLCSFEYIVYDQSNYGSAIWNFKK